MTENACHQSSFEKAIGDFTGSLPRRYVEDFRSTTLEHLRTRIAALQHRLHAQRRLQNLNRLQPFIEAIVQYGQVVSELYHNTDIVAFIWGPLKFLLQTTSKNDAAFRELLNVYEDIGEAFPLLLQYRHLFRVNPHMVQVLAHMYEDILMFQRIVLRYFQQPLWQAVFSESWKTCKSRFPGIIRNIAIRRSLIEGQATPSQIEESRENLQHSLLIEERQFDEQTLQQIRNVLNWLRPTNVDVDQAALVETRAEYPGTGHWLLENKIFKEWFDPRYPTIPPLLWLNGLPGAGKTMLASLVIQKAQELNQAPAVLYFYCKHNNPERDNFVALGRSLLAQLLYHDNGLLPTFYQESCRSIETILSSPSSIKDLLALAFGNCKSAYIILDGMDECPCQERQNITKWFRELVENLPNYEPERLRCLFVSQNDRFARKDYDGLERIEIKAEDSQRDIEEYCRVKADKLLDCRPFLPGDVSNLIARRVANSVEGHFLLAKLVWTNLSSHTSIVSLEEELAPNVFPGTVDDAYRRIIIRIGEHTLQEQKEGAFRLLGWIACARRPLKCHEIQGMSSINLEERRVNFDRQSSINSMNELLASLVETRADGSLEFVHLTAKFFLLNEGYVVPSREEIKLASLCIDYLNLPTFISPPTVEGVLNGDYGFMDYAVLFWLRHLEIAITLKTDEDDVLLERGQLAESLEIFIDQHWNSPATELKLAKRHSDKLKCFKDLPLYDRLIQVVASTRKQLRHLGNMNPKEVALNLSDTVRNVRQILEKIASNEPEPKTQQILRKIYGTNLFKCPRFNCPLFTDGFSSAAERDVHVAKHEQPFQCPEEACFAHTIGFSSETQLENHMRKNHLEISVRDEDFPTEEEVERSVMKYRVAADKSQAKEERLDKDDSSESATTPATEQPKSEPESETKSQYRPLPKRPRMTAFKCEECDMVFQKRYNLTSHRLKHNTPRENICSVCQKSFARTGDLKRHMNSHSGNKSLTCGCGRSFARAETLSKHQQSRVGRLCKPQQESEERALVSKSQKRESEERELQHADVTQESLKREPEERVLQYAEDIMKSPA